MQYEIDFMPVGTSHGDAICMRYWLPDNKFAVDVIDGGYAETGENVVRHLASFYGTRHINNLVLTHSDTDHALGLIPIMQACTVDCLYMNLPWLYVDYVQHLYNANYKRENLIRDIRDANDHLVKLVDLAQQSGHTEVRPIFQDTTVGCMTVLAPTFPRYVQLIPSLRGPEPVRKPKPLPTLASILAGAADYIDSYLEDWGVETLSPDPEPPTSDSNESSVVQLGQFGDYRVLFTGDAGPVALLEAAERATQLGLRRPNLFQIPHQGSRHNVTPAALNAWLGPPLPAEAAHAGWATCSVGTNKPSHPRKKVTNACLRRGYKCQAAREGGLRYSNFDRPNWTTSTDSIISFHRDTREIDD